MIADLHAHYAMRLVPEAQGTAYDLLSTAKGRARLRDRLRALLVGLAGRFANYRSFESGPRVTVESMRSGGVGVALSVLYSFFDELDLGEPYGAPPEPGYLQRLVRQLELVEEDIASRHADDATVVHSPAELGAALTDGKLALVHCVEGASTSAPRRRPSIRGWRSSPAGASPTSHCHAFWLGVATNSPALPFLPDRLYKLLFPQPKLGLSELGRAAVRAMVRERAPQSATANSPRSTSSAQ